jgi:hypothetical protein
MNFFICNRYDSKNEDIYLISPNNAINDDQNKLYQEVQSNNNEENRFVIEKYNNRKKPASESLEESEELQIIDYPYKQQQNQFYNIFKNDKSKYGGSFINNKQYFDNFNNTNNIEENNFENKVKKDNKNVHNHYLSNSNFERIIDDKIFTEEFELDDTIKGEDNFNISKLYVENKTFKNNLNNNNFSPMYTTEKSDNNNLYCKNYCNIKSNTYAKNSVKPNNHFILKNNIKNNLKSNSNKKINLNQNSSKKTVHSSKSYKKEIGKIEINNYKDFSSYNKIIRNIKNKINTNRDNASNIFNHNFSEYFIINRNKNKSTNRKKNDYLITKNLSGNNMIISRNKEINKKKFNLGESVVLGAIKKKLKKNKTNLNNLRNGKSLDREKSDYSAKEVIRKFRHFKRKNLP